MKFNSSGPQNFLATQTAILWIREYLRIFYQQLDH
jgi:hypothetical protein